ncbi:MAG: hypothetical protein WC876_01865 [Candidatus Thermoplasmatota archaeon]
MTYSPGASAVCQEPPSLARNHRVIITPAQQAHCEALAPLLRPEDVAEAEAMLEDFSTPLHCLEASVAQSSCAWAALVDGQVDAMFGVVPFETAALEHPRGLIWFVTGQGFPRHALAFARVARPVIRALFESFGPLCNYIDARYLAAVRWAKWLGFVVGAPVPFGPKGLLFHPARLEVL